MIESAGILLFRREKGLEVFLVHPGGPFWAAKDAGAWSIPKGGIGPGEDKLAAARREFAEETGFAAAGTAHALGRSRISSGKNLEVWAVEGDCDPSMLKSNHFEMEWPPKSGKRQSFPEVDRGGWFGEGEALEKITKGQRPILEKFFANLP